MVWRDRLARFGVAWIERYLSVVGVTVEVLREQGDISLVEELMDDSWRCWRRSRADSFDCGRHIINADFSTTRQYDWGEGGNR